MNDPKSIESSLKGLAYRMTGSMAEAEDILQEAWLRFLPRKDQVEHPHAFFRTIVVRLCLDKLKAASTQRVDYIGEYLPETVLGGVDTHYAPDATHELAEDISFGLLLTLERLSPAERAAFLLKDIFDADFAEIAASLGQSESTCRKLAQRARQRLKGEGRQLSVDRRDHHELAGAFFDALRSGNRHPIEQHLAQDAIMYADGGGKRPTVLRPIYGASKIARYFEGATKRWPPREIVGTEVINGTPGLVVRDVNGYVFALCVEVTKELGCLKISRVFIQKNPDKLAAVIDKYERETERRSSSA